MKRVSRRPELPMAEIPHVLEPVRLVPQSKVSQTATFVTSPSTTVGQLKSELRLPLVWCGTSSRPRHSMYVVRRQKRAKQWKLKIKTHTTFSKSQTSPVSSHSPYHSSVKPTATRALSPERPLKTCRVGQRWHLNALPLVCCGRLPAGVVQNHGSKITFVPKAPRVAKQCDVNNKSKTHSHLCRFHMSLRFHTSPTATYADFTCIRTCADSSVTSPTATCATISMSQKSHSHLCRFQMS
ncbi:hypothetical protein TNCV_3632411 [Trichonephila clavipes]|nr:hypothetical protein TNCV_3632411 [Trichonephila clavipes]